MAPFPWLPRVAPEFAGALLPLVVLALFGFFRIRRLLDVLEPDWQIVIEFGAALRAFAQSGGHDARALAAMEALAPDVAPLVAGLRGPEAPLADLPGLARARQEPGGDAATAARDRLESLRGQIEAAEWLLQVERKRIARAEASLRAWLHEGAAGVALAFLGALGDRNLAARTRRRMLEADPRFQRAVRALLYAGIAVCILLTLGGLIALAGRVVQAVRGAAS